MFNKKFALGMCQLLAAMLMAKIILITTMFIWGFFGDAPVQVFDARVEGIVKYLLFIQEVGSTLFIYILVVAMKYFICCHGVVKAKPMEMKVPMISAPVAKTHVVAKKRSVKSNA